MAHLGSTDGPLRVYGPRSATYDFGPGHPLTPRRFEPGIDLLRAVGAEPGLAPEPATDDELPRQWATLAAKFHDLVVPVAGEPAADELVARIARFEHETTVGELLALTRPEEVVGR